jgi:hypothetical protein
MGDSGVGEGVSAQEAVSFSKSQEAIGLGQLGLTAADLSSVTKSGIEGAMGSTEATSTVPGGGGEQAPLEPRAWEAQKAEQLKEETLTEEQKKRKRRRRPSLLIEEDGLLNIVPSFQRSLLR